MSQQNTALIDDIMAALDAESSQNVELIVRNTQNGATKKMALASLEQIIYSYLTTAPVVTNLASVLGVPSYAEVNWSSYLDAAAISAVLSAYEQTGAFSVCSGSTGAGSECAWYGMKHHQVGELLILCRGGILCITITNPNTITKTYCIVNF